jgi:lysophospholipase L1-like esterase
MSISKQSEHSAVRQLGKRLLLLTGSVLVACILVEGLARLLFPQWAPRTAIITKFWQYDPKYGWSHIPGATGLFRSYGIDTTVRINSKGFRGPEVSYSRNGSSPRVLVLGDSLVWGFGVEFDEVFTAQIEQLIPNVEVVNLGVSGYSTDQELLLYRDEGRRYQVDLVVIVVAANDNASNARTVEYLIYGKPAFSLHHGILELMNQPVAKPSWVKRAAVRMGWHSFVLTQLHRYLYPTDVVQAHIPTQPATEKSTVVDAPNGTRADLPGPLAAWEITARLLLELKEATAKDGVELLVVFSDGIGIRAARTMSDFLAKFDINSVLLDEHLDTHDKSFYVPDMVHWSPAGHKIVAAVLAEKVRQKLHRHH